MPADPKLPDRLWAVRNQNGQWLTNPSGVAHHDEMGARLLAEIFEGEAVLIGVSPARLERAEARIAELEQQIARMYRVALTDPEYTHDEVKPLEPGRTAHASMLINLWNRAESFKVVGQQIKAFRARVAELEGEVEAAQEHIRRLVKLVAPQIPRPLDDWHDDAGPVIWWKFPIRKPPYVGSPLDSDWPDYHTHWTPILLPENPTEETPHAR